MELNLNSLVSEPYANLHWQMTNYERFALQDLMRRLRPDVAIEVGTYQGGSLQVLSSFANHVDSIDIDASVPKRLGKYFRNVDFHTGDSSVLLPDLLRKHQSHERHVGFILIDGDHSTEGVRKDIEAILSVDPIGPLVIVMHDAFNPACCEGIRMANWNACPYVQEVEIDFVPGAYFEFAYDTAEARSMWGGLACAIVDSKPRVGDLCIGAQQQGLFDAAYPLSSHCSTNSNEGVSPLTPLGLLRRIRNKVRLSMA